MLDLSVQLYAQVATKDLDPQQERARRMEVGVDLAFHRVGE